MTNYIVSRKHDRGYEIRFYKVSGDTPSEAVFGKDGKSLNKGELMDIVVIEPKTETAWGPMIELDKASDEWKKDIINNHWRR